MSGNPKLTPETEAKIKVLLYPKPPLTEGQELLLTQAQNCRDLAHFLRTDPRVEGHFDMRGWTFGVKNGEMPLACDTTACAIGWAWALGMCDPHAYNWERQGRDAFASEVDEWEHVFAAKHKRTSQEEAQVLEAHATKLEARV